MKFIREGKTIPPKGHLPWLTRNDEQAERDGWDNFGQGPGLLRLVWDNAEFKGVPRVDGCAVPWTWQTDASGCEVPGAVRYVGEWICPPGLGDGIYFVVSLPRDTEEKKTAAVGRLLLDGELIGGHQTRAWAEENGLADTDPRDWPIVRDHFNWMKPEPDGQSWVEIVTDKMQFADGQRMKAVIEYAVPEGDNHFACKVCNEDVSDDYHFAEIFPRDLCTPDHTLVTPTTVEQGDPILVTWWTTQHPTVRLNGEDVGTNGHRELTPTQTTDYTFEVGGQRRTFTVTVK